MNTPTPWTVRHDGGFSAGIKIRSQAIVDGGFADAIATMDGDPGDPQAEADAAYIVRAVNNHAELVSVLNAILDFAEDDPDGSAKAYALKRKGIRTLARNAIDKAQAE